VQEQEKAPLWQSLHEQVLVDQLMQLLSQQTQPGASSSPGTDAGIGAGARAAPQQPQAALRGGGAGTEVEPLTLEFALRQPPPVADDGRRLPLTW
jgi:hypothetical protein